MTTEDDFQRALDAHPEDCQTRLVFADWLQERDDPRAEGYRVLGLLRKWPYKVVAASDIDREFDGLARFYHNEDSRTLSPDWNHTAIPVDWFFTADPNGDSGGSRVSPIWNRPRREVENAAAHAFALLPPARRQAILLECFRRLKTE